MDAQAVRNLLADGMLLFDGATGTYAKSMPDWPEGAVELACISSPQKVRQLHRAYLDVGCSAIKTNTFAAHVGLAAENEDMQRSVIAAAVAAAQSAAQGRAAVFADIGPAPVSADAAYAYVQMADYFLDCGISCFLFETMPALDGIAEAAAHIRTKNPQAFIAVSFAADPDGFTRAGEHAASLIAQMDECDAVDAVGLNCICGAYHLQRLIAGLPRTKKHLLAMPNAGYPHVIDGRTYYDSDPIYYAQQVIKCVSHGAKILGGCCGTTPEHLRCIASSLKKVDRNSSVKTETEQGKNERGCRSRVAQKLSRGERVILVELDPPRDSGIAAFLDGAKRLSGGGADAVTIADCPIGRARMDSSLLACKLSRELGIEAIPHMTCRDRNVNATKALLLGLSMEGVRNVLAVTGDPVPTDDRDSVKGVFQFNSRVLARFVHSLSQSGETEPFFLCGALNINAVNFDAELEKAQSKEACGVEAFLTQPVLSRQAVENIKHARNMLKGKILGGLFPVVSCNNARFLQSEVAGITVDDRVVAAYDGLDRAQGEELAVRLCRDAAQQIEPYVDGYYIMTPFQRVELVCRVMKEIRRV
ncbi:MAG: bifunctional homocysteine S-methyltransferase/methylenetetrahydrofolate reductase [Clostridiales bacterium]|nr:bifunctional homocysteine S-methyltransferase/methylenetetrahydrofolate reductase [Clostridiales bacterium]